MGSLTAHLLEAGDHGRLRFHPSCPVCRQERLFGTLSSEPVVSRRAQAVLAGGVLALSAAAPGASAAVEPDHQREGVVAPELPPGGELDDPGFDPGGETQLPYETAPVPTPLGGDEEDSGEGVPLDVEPGVDLEGRLAPLAEPDSLATDAPVPPAEPVVPGTAVPPSAPDPSLGTDTAAPPAEQPAPDEQPEQDQGSTRDRKTADHHKARGPAKPGYGRSGGGAPPQPVVTGETPEVAAAPAPSVPPAQPVAVAQTSPSPPETPEDSLRNARSYVVEPGDSLWSIAKRLLGPEASPARIAREVNRLWSLNRARIATGDPDLLMIGTRLRLE